MALPSDVTERDPEVQALLITSLRLIARAEGLYEQVSSHQRQMRGLLDRVQSYVDGPWEERNGVGGL